MSTGRECEGVGYHLLLLFLYKAYDYHDFGTGG